MNTMTLSTGVEIQWRPVPPYVGAKVLGQYTMPEPPTKVVSTPAGEQEVPVGEDTPLFEQYIRDAVEAEQEQLEALTKLTLDYGIVAWRKPPEAWWQKLLAAVRLAYCWYEEPPRRWDIPDALKRAGIDMSDSRRLDYIYIYLVSSPADLTRVVEAIQSVTRDLASEEVGVVETSFRAGEGRGGAADTTDEPDQGADAVRGDEDSEGVGADA